MEIDIDPTSDETRRRKRERFDQMRDRLLPHQKKVVDNLLEDDSTYVFGPNFGKAPPPEPRQPEYEVQPRPMDEKDWELAREALSRTTHTPPLDSRYGRATDPPDRMTRTDFMLLAWFAFVIGAAVLLVWRLVL